MKDFIDKTSSKAGTPINRANLMAVQGFVSGKTTFNSSDNTITETNDNGETMVTKFNTDGSITQTFTGERTIEKKITFSGNTITEKVV